MGRKPGPLQQLISPTQSISPVPAFFQCSMSQSRGRFSLSPPITAAARCSILSHLSRVSAAAKVFRASCKTFSPRLLWHQFSVDQHHAWAWRTSPKAIRDLARGAPTHGWLGTLRPHRQGAEFHEEKNTKRLQSAPGPSIRVLVLILIANSITCILLCTQHTIYAAVPVEVVLTLLC